MSPPADAAQPPGDMAEDEEAMARLLEEISSTQGRTIHYEGLARKYGLPVDEVRQCADAVRAQKDASGPEARAMPGAGTGAPGSPGHPGRVGPYRIVDVLGEGGMGVVYLADQDEPIRRRVALKLMRRDLDARSLLARFEAERQALALLNHPHIAKVYDAGTTESGRPYFAMEHVEGVRITDFCDEHRLTTAERLDLFQRVCEGIQHAHQKGIIHRDIKPSNILVGVNGEASPRIIDFGIAKATGGALHERTDFTELGQILGTPEYMSPEQAGMGRQDIDTRADIYSLGVVLYELLTGLLPFDADELRAAGYQEACRRIREEDPPRPSTRLSTPGDTSMVAASRRGTNPITLVRCLQGDLDWIVMKALEKDRERRYRTASELSADISRHRRHEPVLAGPPGPGYLARKFVRRHRGAVTAAFLILLALLAGLGTTTAMFLEARRQRMEAEEARLAEAREKDEAKKQRALALKAQRKAQEERDVAVAAQEAEKAARREAERQETLARDAQREALVEAEKFKQINDFLQNMLSSVDPGRDGRKVTVLEVLDREAPDLEGSFPDQPEILSALHETVGRAYHHLGLYDSAEPHLNRALEIRRAALGESHPETLGSMGALAGLWLSQGKPERAEKLLRRTLGLSEQSLGGDHPDTLIVLGNLGRCLEDQGDIRGAEPLYRKSWMGLQRELGPDDPISLIAQGTLASALNHLGRPKDAEGLYREALEGWRRVRGERHWDTCICMSSLAAILKDQRELREARDLYERSLEGLREVAGEEHPQTLAVMSNLGYVLSSLGRMEEAEPLLVAAQEGFQKALGPDHPNVMGALAHVAELRVAQGKLKEAETQYRRLLESLRRIHGDRNPETLAAMNNLGAILHKQERYAEAEALARQVFRDLTTLVGRGHPKTLLAMDHVMVLLQRQGKHEEAVRLGEEMVSIASKSLPEDDWRLGHIRGDYGICLLDLRRFEEAEVELRKACTAAAEGGNIPLGRQRVLLEALVKLYEQWGKPEEAKEYRERLEESRRSPPEN